MNARMNLRLKLKMSSASGYLLQTLASSPVGSVSMVVIGG